MESLLPALLVLAFVLLRLLGSRKQQRQDTQQHLPSEEVHSDGDMDEALRQIREALGMPTPVASPPDLPARLPVPVSPPTPRPAPPARVMQNEVRVPARRIAEGPVAPRPVKQRVAPPSASAATDTTKSLLDALDSPDAAGRALLLGEVFGPPHSKRRRS